MKRTITTCLAGLFPVFLLSAQSGLPSRISTPVVVGETSVKSSGEWIVSPEGKVKNNGTVTLAQALTLKAGGENVAGLMENRSTLYLRKGVVFHSNDDSDGMLANFGTVNLSGSVASDVRLVKTFTESKYYYFSLPFPVDFASIKDLDATGDLSPEMTLNSSFRINEYDGAQRAETGNKLAWKTASSIAANTGYAFMVSKGRVGHAIAFSATGISGLYPGEKTLDVPYHVSTSDFKDSTKCTGWNYIGNSHTTTFEVKSSTTDFRGEVHFFSKKGGNYEVMQLTGNDGTDVTNTAPPFAALFTHGLEDGPRTFTFKQAGISNNFSGLRSAKNRINRLAIKLTSDANAYYDKTRILIGEEYLAGYEASEDATKMYSPYEAAPCLWSFSSDQEDLSINRLPDPGAAAIRLGYLTGAKGQYTLSLDEDQMDDYEQILLQDNLTDVETNLRESSYTFSASLNENSSDRFTLSFLRAVTDLPSLEKSRAWIYGSNGRVYVKGIQAGDRVVVYDLTGRLVSNALSEDDEYVSEAMDSGLYIVKVSGSTVATAKIKN